MGITDSEAEQMRRSAEKLREYDPDAPVSSAGTIGPAILRLLDERDRLSKETTAMRSALEQIAALDRGFTYEYRKIAETALRRVEKLHVSGGGRKSGSSGQ